MGWVALGMHRLLCMQDWHSHTRHMIRHFGISATTRAGLRSATSGSVAVPRTTSSLGDRSFAVAAPRAWNTICHHHFVALIPAIHSNANWKDFSLPRHLSFFIIFWRFHIVRRPCCVSRTYVAVILTFWFDLFPDSQTCKEQTGEVRVDEQKRRSKDVKVNSHSALGLNARRTRTCCHGWLFHS